MTALGEALAWLDGHQDLERILAQERTGPPDPARMQRLVDLLGHPEAAAPVIHITGTNGKTSTARAVTALLMAKGLTVGTFTSPHLERINERITVDGEPIADDDLADVLTDLATIEPLLPDDHFTWFELLTAAAFRWFADRPVDVVVLEVGLGGRWDATNVADAVVAVVTNIGLDHIELLGPTRAHVATEKAGIVKPDSTLVLGERDPDLYGIFAAEGPSELWWAGRDFETTRNDLAVGGRVLDIRTPGGSYEEVWLGLHGRHQVDNFAAALVAVETFFGSPLEARLVREAAGVLRSPGRLEVMGRHPLVILDGAKNLEGARAAARAIDEEIGVEAVRSRILVVGLLAGKDATEMLTALDATSARLIITCPPPSPRAQTAAAVAAAARALPLRPRPPHSHPQPQPDASPDTPEAPSSTPRARESTPGASGAAPGSIPGASGAPSASGPTSGVSGSAPGSALGGGGGNARPEVIEAETVSDAIDIALAAAGEDDLVLVTGSLYVVGAARAVLGIRRGV